MAEKISVQDLKMSSVLKTDVTAVKIYKNLILAGIGSSVHIYEKGTSKLNQRLNCLRGQKIYGIVAFESSTKLVVFGGKQFTVVRPTTRNSNDATFSRLFEPVVCNDWIHSIVWIDEDNIAVLTAHNVVQTWNTSDQHLVSQHCSKDNSILYSGLLLPLTGAVLVLAGTVFSEVILHISGQEQSLQRLVGHKGVIFSISCDLQRGFIVTTSDDRSVRIWVPKTASEHSCNTVSYWKEAELVCKHELYGHTARVMRSWIGIDKVISVGEDSAICFWNLDGTLAKKILSHQSACVWSVDGDESIVVTGGGDGAVITHPATVATQFCNSDTIDFSIGSPKKIVFTARRNLVVLNESDELIYYNVEEKRKYTQKVCHESTYKLMSVSSCKQMIAVADMNGKLDVFAESCKETAILVKIIDTKLLLNKILSMQWVGNRHLVLCLENGVITVLASKESTSETYTDFLLPNCKERWLTSAAVDSSKNMFVVGDRCGNVHIYLKGQRNPLKSFNKVHGRYGPTSITIKYDEIITTGRDGTIKYFSFNNHKVKLMYSKDLEFKWIEKFLDKDENIVCGFQERVFIVFNIKSNTRLLEVPCGGGHRSWDAIRYFEKVGTNYEESIKLVYLKNSEINTVEFQLSKIVSKNNTNGSHSKEINCLRTHRSEDKSMTFVISGGEDTTLRVSYISSEQDFIDLTIFKQLSSIRTLKTCSVGHDSFIVMSAGGRAQLCIKIVTYLQLNNEIAVKSYEIGDYMIKGTDKERKGNQNWRNCSVDFDPETRIMDLDHCKIEDNVLRIFAGCSDAMLRIFTLAYKDPVSLELTKELKYHNTCILKTTCIHFMNRNVLMTCSTRSEVAFWDVSDIREDLQPFFVTKTNKSGINSFAYKVISNDQLLIVTGGDDNAMHLVLLEANQNDLTSLKVLDSKVFDQHHSSQITGVCLVDKFILSTSIDQRISLFEWSVMSDVIRCTFLSQSYSDVADIQGMDVITLSSSSITVCVFGKGMEVIEIQTSH